jgi:hypothetical protein
LPWSFLEELNPVKYSGKPYFRKADFRYKNFAQFESILIEHALEIFKTSEDYYRVASSILRRHSRKIFAMWKPVFMRV